VGGTVHGNVHAGKVVLRGDSKVPGDIVYKQLVIEEGASFEGRCDIDTNQPLPESEKLQIDGSVAQEEPKLPTEEAPS
jgi:cytoskeletal protein CcmA (bactofilin family)